MPLYLLFTKINQLLGMLIKDIINIVITIPGSIFYTYYKLFIKIVTISFINKASIIRKLNIILFLSLLVLLFI